MRPSGNTRKSAAAAPSRANHRRRIEWFRVMAPGGALPGFPTEGGPRSFREPTTSPCAEDVAVEVSSRSGPPPTVRAPPPTRRVAAFAAPFLPLPPRGQRDLEVGVDLAVADRITRMASGCRAGSRRVAVRVLNASGLAPAQRTNVTTIGRWWCRNHLRPGALMVIRHRGQLEAPVTRSPRCRRR